MVMFCGGDAGLCHGQGCLWKYLNRGDLWPKTGTGWEHTDCPASAMIR